MREKSSEVLGKAFKKATGRWGGVVLLQAVKGILSSPRTTSLKPFQVIPGKWLLFLVVAAGLIRI